MVPFFVENEAVDAGCIYSKSKIMLKEKRFDDLRSKLQDFLW